MYQHRIKIYNINEFGKNRRNSEKIKKFLIMRKSCKNANFKAKESKVKQSKASKFKSHIKCMNKYESVVVRVKPENNFCDNFCAIVLKVG